MARKLTWPLPDGEKWRQELGHWWQLSSDDRLEVLKAWSDDQDRRLEAVEKIIKSIKVMVIFILTSTAGVFLKEYVSSYQIVRTGQVVLPGGSAVPSTNPDRVVRPAPPSP